MSEVDRQLTLERPPAEAHVIDLESYRLARRNRLLGRLAIKAEQRLLNNDALSPVFLKLESGEAADRQIRLEYRGDMSERSGITGPEGLSSDERPFQTKLDYRFVDGELAYAPTGKLLKNILGDGVAAAYDDYRERPADYQYHLERAQVLANHGPEIINWLDSDPKTCGVIGSVEPSAEIGARLAKLGGFKPDRQMASMWILEPVSGGLNMHVFSLDKMTLDRLQYIYNSLRVDIKVDDTTIAELARIRQLNIKDGQEAVDRFRQIHDAKLDIDFPQDGPHHHGIKKAGKVQTEAYKLVEAKPEAEELHMQAVKAVAESLQKGKVTRDLAKLIMEMRRPFAAGSIPKELQIGGGRLELAQAREFMDYLRRKAISEYIFGDQTAHAAHYQGGDGGSGVAAAGSYSESKGTSRDGDCPSSDSNSPAANANSEAGKAMGVHQKNGEDARENWVWSKGVCLIEKCPTRPGKTEVGPCSVCHECQDIYDAGDDPNDVYGRVGIIDLLLESIDRSGQESKAKREQEKAIKLARQKALEAQEQTNLEVAA